jgi:hypothetical protein
MAIRLKIEKHKRSALGDLTAIQDAATILGQKRKFWQLFNSRERRIGCPRLAARRHDNTRHTEKRHNIY